MIALLAAVLIATSPRAEVDALLERLEQSDCRFHRNGEWYGPRKAREHLERALRINPGFSPRLAEQARKTIKELGPRP